MATIAETAGPPVPEEIKAQHMSYAETTATLAERLAEDDSHGYSQNNRYGDGTTVTENVSGKDYELHGKDYDCSSLVGEVLKAQGLIPEDTDLFTWNEDKTLTDAGFEKMPYDPDNVQRGDILYREGHTGVAIGNGQQADASHGDRGTDGDAGDQDGTEVLKRDLQDSWTTIYRPPEGTHYEPEPQQQAEPEQETDYSSLVADGAEGATNDFLGKIGQQLESFDWSNPFGIGKGQPQSDDQMGR